MEANSLSQKECPPDNEPRVEPNPHNTQEERQRIKVMFTLLHCVGDRLVLQMCQGDQKDVQNQILKLSWWSNVKCILVDGIVDQFID